MNEPDSHSRRFRFLAQLIPLCLTLAALANFIRAPGFGTFLLAVLAFLLWVMIMLMLYALRAALRARAKIEHVVSDLLGDHSPFPAREAQPLDPAVRELWRKLTSFDADSDLRPLAKTARKQLTLAPKLFSDFRTVLESKLHTTEITFDRYLSTGQRALDGVLQEVREVQTRLQSIHSISDPTLDVAKREQIQKIQMMLAKNEEAISGMSRINIAISGMKSLSGRQEGQIQEIVAELDELSRRAKKY